MLLPASDARRIAYFSMEIGVDPSMPTYSGGLGVLAGDSMRAAADLGIPIVAVTLVHRKGYFRQQLDGQGRQTVSPDTWSPESLLAPVEPRVRVTVEGREVSVRAWRYVVQGVSGQAIPVYFLDTDLPDNTPADRAITDELYGGGEEYRLCQEVVLGIGGLRMLRALGHTHLDVYHMNEGHSGLLTLALLEEQLAGRLLEEAGDDDLEAVRSRCVFTTHTPVPAGHDVFGLDLLERVIGTERRALLERLPVIQDGLFNLTRLAVFLARRANGVSLRHAGVSREMFPGHDIGAITNGVHAGTWTSPAFAALFDRYIPRWRRDNRYLRHAVTIPAEDIAHAHGQSKRELLVEVQRRTGVTLDPAAFTIGFARRATGYKRGELLFSDPARLKRIVQRVGPLQVVYAGKAHPRDESGLAIIERVFAAAAALRDAVRVVYLEGYDISLAKAICAGVDVWLNNPQKPLEASGTSGMKAALNGVPSLSVLDGWWIEGHVEGVTGWAIGEDWDAPSDASAEAGSLYDKLEHVILPTFYQRPSEYARIMRSAIALNGSFFNAQRMMSQYLRDLYEPAPAS